MWIVMTPMVGVAAILACGLRVYSMKRPSAPTGSGAAGENLKDPEAAAGATPMAEVSEEQGDRESSVSTTVADKEAEPEQLGSKLSEDEEKGGERGAAPTHGGSTR